MDSLKERERVLKGCFVIHFRMCAIFQMTSAEDPAGFLALNLRREGEEKHSDDFRAPARLCVLIVAYDRSSHSEFHLYDTCIETKPAN